MSTKRHGNKVVSDLTKAILFVIKKGAKNIDEVAELLTGEYSEKQIRKRVYSLKYNRFINNSPSKDFTVSGKGLEALYNLDFKPIRYTKTWDKKWRIVVYDIPESKRAARNRIRQLLKDLGFNKLQLGVWAHPIPCLKQFAQIRQAYGIEKHILLLEVDDSTEFHNLKQHFAKTYSQIKSH